MSSPTIEDFKEMQMELDEADVPTEGRSLRFIDLEGELQELYLDDPDPVVLAKWRETVEDVI